MTEPHRCPECNRAVAVRRIACDGVCVLEVQCGGCGERWAVNLADLKRPGEQRRAA